MGEIDGEEPAAVDVVPQAEDPRPPTAELLRVGRRLQRRSVSQSSTDSTCHPAHPGADQAANDSAGSGKAGDLSTSASGRLAAPGGLTRKESYKDQRRRYRHEKRRAADELLSTVRDPAVLVRADWLKVRGTLKSWTKLWCVLKPGLLILYKSEKAKNSHWVGTILLSSCHLIERPSKKDGFCFKLYHPLEQSIWSTKGPDGESGGATLQLLPTAHLIFRAPTQSSGKCWMDALELSMACSSLLKRSMNAEGGRSWAESEPEGGDLDDSRVVTPVEASAEFGAAVGEDGDSSEDGSAMEDDAETAADQAQPPAIETTYCENVEVLDPELLGGGGQTEELADENKNLLWPLLKQLRPGMDLSKVVLPTFILEPRSFLDKLSDYYYHADYLSRAIHEDDPFLRMRSIVGWYLSGFYKKPKGLKKPYNPILGETFRCYWQHPNGSRTFYIAEQVSHHPPVSAFYVSNRRDGFCISSSILAKSKFYGNSTSAILVGTATLTLLPRGEAYRVTMPYAHCKGILIGTLSMELGGKVTIECEKTGYTTELEFKLKPMWSGQDDCNRVVGKIRLGHETLATIDGKWDGQMYCTDKRTNERETLWNPTPEVCRQRLKRYTVPLDEQGIWESELLWAKVSKEIERDDQVAATNEKFVLEEAQRAAAKERKATCTEWVPKYFVQDCISGEYQYRYADLRPWDPHTDQHQYEADYQVLTRTRTRAPMLRTASLISVEKNLRKALTQVEVAAVVRKELTGRVTRISESSSPDASTVDGGRRREHVSPRRLQQCLQPLEQLQRDTAAELAAVRRQLERLQRAQQSPSAGRQLSPWLVLVLAVLAQLVTGWWLRRAG
ncbi:oxysterol-binding protein-related protein 8-like isoform X1 [Amphibalanus amphitrite]|nr:oxysterol-binding protein-related protein 8-like isoform X1 [Amphibalanus amphitrite]XP_043201384.1 oxysterol-binding protein-related protein 8-like isoform X1 [Amphibalanus amphitrite]XP_043201385.1 oxysterol-binding protein-related protein 8-like isoform X1 [Amphibalanus amphitrite]XP_043201386.1 oxysterol-binding protein-related protein 8-like isoform X1 [Amphibalanus amphitrite]XP_043201388.1 oxysterol-binding protein-related protein 8-like isoform X1 [Amphibalanus amphitrite]